MWNASRGVDLLREAALKDVEAVASMAGICSERIGVLDGGKVLKGGPVSRASDALPFDLLAEDEESNGNLGPPEQGEVEEKRMKRPDKLLPCPRCESLNTKFCYFNNCNPNQPCHICRCCQRYWTAGGTLRNVPVGSGRRKSAMSRHLRIGRSAPTVRVSPQDICSLSAAGIPRSTSLLSYHGKEAPPLGQTLPAAPIGSIGDGMQHKHWNGFAPWDERSSWAPNSLSKGKVEIYASNESNSLSSGSVEAYASNEVTPPRSPVDELVCSYSVVGTQIHSSKDADACEITETSKKATTTTNATTNTTTGEPFAAAGFMGSSPFSFPMDPWPYGYGSFGGDGSFVTPSGPSCPPPLPSWLPWPLMPMLVPSWPFGSWGGVPWNAPFLPPWGPPSYGPASPILGKHPREESKEYGCLLIPKTLRTQDPKEAAQSTIWSSLGLDNRSDFSTSIDGIFKGFPPKADVAESEDLTVQAFCANPAAETQSTTFQENISSVLIYEY